VRIIYDRCITTHDYGLIFLLGFPFEEGTGRRAFAFFIQVLVFSFKIMLIPHHKYKGFEKMRMI
jgi:hypothetical protein